MTAMTRCGGSAPAGMSCHGWKERMAGKVLGGGRGGLRRPDGAAMLPPARVAEWQTQRTQNPPGATPCEFDSRLGHSNTDTHLGARDESDRGPLFRPVLPFVLPLSS